MTTAYIDKLAFIELKNRKVLVTLSTGKDTWYIPGGKRELDETDEQALIREVREELSVEIDVTSIRKYGVFHAQAHGKPPGTIVRMTCYFADHDGILHPSTEIEKMDFFDYAQRDRCSDVDILIFEDLKQHNLID